jgi:hypothetical protein
MEHSRMLCVWAPLPRCTRILCLFPYRLFECILPYPVFYRKPLATAVRRYYAFAVRQTRHTVFLISVLFE